MTIEPVTRRRFGALAFAAAATAALPNVALADNPPDPESPFGQALGVLEEASPPPPHPVLLADGSRRELASYTGRPSVVTFWATWCAICAQELPALDRLNQAMGGSVRFLPLSIDTQTSRGDPATLVERFYQARGISSLPMMFDEGEQNAEWLFVNYTPTSLVMNKDGLVVGLIEGGAPWERPEARAYLQALADA